jgi:patatin-like phospholipase/acyl hydrolase
VALRVLTIDGGGTRCLIPARVLAQLEQLTGRPTADLFDLIAGSAAGAILALGLVAPGHGQRPRFTASQLADLYLERGHDLAPSPQPVSRFRRLIGLPATHPAAAPLAERFGETPLGDALVDVLVSTFDPAAAAALILRSSEFVPGSGPPMRDVALASSSMPTHYPPVQVDLSARAVRLTHGGLVANNPSGFAYAAALARAEPSEVVLVSLGTNRLGDRRNGTGRRSDRWPLSAGHCFELHLEVAREAQHQILEAQLAATGNRDRYWRLEPTLQPHLEDYERGEPVAISEVAERYVEELGPQLDQVAGALA